ncbi:MAG: hypothetical protein M3T96_10470 [Acidobacteriota bacterium]|nr:hypothetical protein [Acidobacteriota bacterium]
MFISVPFKTRNSNGVSHIEGIGKFSPAGIVLEFESKLFGIISSGVKESQISLADILDLTFHKGFLKKGAKIIIRLKNYSKLIEMPNRDGKITLQIPRDDFQRASEAVELLNKHLAEHEQNQPPPHTPVSRLFDESEDETKELNNK